MEEKINTMQNKNTFSILFLLFVVLLNVGCDQVSKTIVRQKIDFNQNINVIDKHFTLTKVENTGAFLSAGDSLPTVVRIALLSVFPLLVLGYGFYYLFTQKDASKALQIGICFLIGGGIGNIFDRLMYGSVTDFMHMDFGLFRTGIFNMADVSVMIGVGIMFIQSFKKKVIQTPTIEETA